VTTRGRRGARNTGSIAAVDSRSPDSYAARGAVQPATLAVVVAAFCWGLNTTSMPLAWRPAGWPIDRLAEPEIAATTEPVFATGPAWLLPNQSLGAAQLAGGGLVVGGVVVAQFARRQ
jgi:hypothetical protein